MESEKVFVGKDLDLLVAALSASESLFGAAHAVKLTEDVLKYPIASVDDFTAVLDRHGGSKKKVRVGKREVGHQHAVKYLRPELFPINNQEQLLGAFILAFETEREERRKVASEEQPPAT